jgi:hypothetical protein
MQSVIRQGKPAQSSPSSDVHARRAGASHGQLRGLAAKDQPRALQ